MPGTLGPGIGYGRASRYKYIATAGQTTFTGADSSASALTLAYTALPGCLKVFIDGILQSTDEYTATNGTSVVFPTGLAVGRVVEMEALSVFSVGMQTVSPGVATPAGGTTTAVLLFGTTSGFGIYFGFGVPTVSAAQGSIYIRSDGSSTSTRLYVNTNGTTGWTNFTSAT